MTADNAGDLVNNLTSIFESDNSDDQNADNLEVLSDIMEDVTGLIRDGAFNATDNVNIRNKIFLCAVLATFFLLRTSTVITNVLRLEKYLQFHAWFEVL